MLMCVCSKMQTLMPYFSFADVFEQQCCQIDCFTLRDCKVSASEECMSIPIECAMGKWKGYFCPRVLHFPLMTMYSFVNRGLTKLSYEIPLSAGIIIWDCWIYNIIHQKKSITTFYSVYPTWLWTGYYSQLSHTQVVLIIFLSVII